MVSTARSENKLSGKFFQTHLIIIVLIGSILTGYLSLTEISIKTNQQGKKIQLSGPKASYLKTSLPNAIVEQITPFCLDDTNFVAIARQKGLIDIYCEPQTEPIISLTENIRLATDFLLH